MAGATIAFPPFEAMLYPNPPLGRHGFLILMGCVTAVSVVIAGVALAAGAWPVSGYFGIDVLLLYVAFRANTRQSRRRELIRLDETGLHVRRVGPNGRYSDWRFEPYWVRVVVEEPVRGVAGLSLRSHGQQLRIAQFLSPAERRDLARALNGALAAYR
jgi:uncharacterized membrane protein